MSTRQVKITYAIVAVLIAFIMLIPSMAGGGAQYASAAATSYSDVLDDLKKDAAFNPEAYPKGGGKYKIEIIQVAESSDGDLFLYTYQPYGSLEASSVSISKTIGANYSPKKYDLELLNSDGVFYKYKAKDFELEPDALRYYNISQIWRKYDSQIDGADASTVETAYKVAKLWTASTVGDDVSYTLKETETIEILNPYAGFVRYPDGVTWTGTQKCDGHFIAFNTDRNIDRLLEADVEYRTKEYSVTVTGGTTYGEPSEKQYKTVNHTETTSNDACHLFGKQKAWKRISKTSDFINDVGLTDDTIKNKLLGCTWILNFLETPYTSPMGGDNAIAFIFGIFGLIYNGVDALVSETKGTMVDEVVVLRLKFEKDGETYNLGTVSNVTRGPMKPSGEITDYWQDFWNNVGAALSKMPWWGWALIVLGVVLVVLGILSIFFPAVRKVFSVILKILVAIAKGLWWLICLPFKCIAAMFRTVKNRVAERKQRKEEERQAKLEQEQQMRLYKHRAGLKRKENKRQQKLDDKDAKKTQKAKDKQSAKRNKKAAKKRRQAAKKRSKNKKKGKGKTK